MQQLDPTPDAVHRVVATVADKEGVDPAELRPPLGSVIEADALATLCESMETGEVEFRYRGYEITVGSDGGVSVRE